MDTSTTGNSAPESRIHFNARMQVRENGLKSRWNFGLGLSPYRILALSLWITENMTLG